MRPAEQSLRDAALNYVRECDNPIPDGPFRKTLRDNLRAKLKAFDELDVFESKSRKRKP